MRPTPFQYPFRRAWSLLEIMIVVVLVALLCALTWQGYSIFVKKGEEGACVGRIKNFHAGILAYVQDHGQWPQEDVLSGPNAKPPDEEVLWDWWFKELKGTGKNGYGISEDDWYCPSDLALRKKEAKMDEEENKSGFKPAIREPSYIPAKFGPGPYAPYEAPNQPWVTERYGHPGGMNKVMPNGTVQKEFNFKAIKRGP